MSSGRSHLHIHPGSLLPIASHNPYLVHLMGMDVSPEMIKHVARHAENVIRIEDLPPPTTHRRVTFIDHYRLPPSPSRLLTLEEFIAVVVKRASVPISTLLTTIIYLERLRTRLNPMATGNLPCTRHRIFLASLIVTAKYLNDSAPKNSHWRKHASMFNIIEINMMEMQLLHLLDYDLRFDEAEACKVFASFMSSRAQDASARARAVDRVIRAGRARAQAQAQALQVQAREVASPPAPPLEEDDTRPLLCTESQRKPSFRFLPRRAPVPPPMHNTTSIDSLSSSSSSEVGSLIDDTGSSSSSSGWASSDSESSEDDEEPVVYEYNSVPVDLFESLSLSHLEEFRVAAPVVAGKKPFALRPIPTYPQKAHRYPRSRLPSDTSSVTTITPASPPPPSAPAPPSVAYRAPKRVPSISLESLSLLGNEGQSHGGGGAASKLAASSASSLPRWTGGASGSGGFFSRMWGAATGSARGPGSSSISANQNQNQNRAHEVDHVAGHGTGMYHSGQHPHHHHGQGYGHPAQGAFTLRRLKLATSRGATGASNIV